MAEKHVVFALVERRARLAGELRAKQAEVLHLKRALASVDLCISMFKADYHPKSVVPKVTLGKNPAGLPNTMLAKTIHSSFSRQRNPVVVYDRSATWPGKWRLLPPEDD
jgi:hypothetical protein